MFDYIYLPLLIILNLLLIHTMLNYYKRGNIYYVDKDRIKRLC